MPRAQMVQTSFSSGVQDPLLAGRVDLKHYYEGLKTGENILPMLQGGFSRRPGSAYLGTVPGDGRLEAFAFNSEQLYCIYFGDSEVRVFRPGIGLVATIASPWPLSVAHELGIAQAADTMIICHEDYAPRKLVRGATHSDWSISNYELRNIPLGDYLDADSPVLTAEIHTLTFTSTATTGDDWQSGDHFRLQIARDFESQRIYWTSNTNLLAKRIKRAVVGVLTGERDAIADSTNIVAYTFATAYQGGKVRVKAARIQGLTGDGVTVDASAYPVVTITLDDGDADAYQEVTITQVETAATNATVTSVLTQEGARRREPVFSATRGWPKFPMFYEGRLWFGGCKSLPQAVFATVSNDYSNMGLGDSLDDDGIFFLLDTDQVNAVTGLVPGRNLIILTTGSEHVILDKPVTPGTAFAPVQTDYGSLPIKPALLEGAAIFAHKRGKQLMEMVFFWQEDAYTAKSVSLLSQHLIRQPRQMAAQKGTSQDTANYLFTINGDGTIACMLSSRAQEVAAWSIWDTAGSYKSVCVVEEELFVLVQRTINGAARFHVEQFATNLHTDSAVLKSLPPETSVVTGLDHLEGETVKVRADGDVLFPDAQVVGGQIALPRTAELVEVGINYIPLAESMPPAPNFGGGPSLMATKRITWVKLLVNQSRGLRINGDNIPDRQTDVDPLDTPPPERTGVIEHRPTNSRWELLPTVTITQTDPHPMRVLAATYEVEVNER